VRLLLDTHTLLWFAHDDPNLSTTARALIVDPANDIWVSPASFWEIAIKVSTGKYTLSAPFETFMERAIDGNDFEILPITIKHAAVLTTLPFHHRDPFDRLLVAQVMSEGVSILSNDTILDSYPVTRRW